MIQAVIFDFDGTLADSLETIAYFGNFALAEKGFGAISKDRYRHLVGDGRNTLIHRMLAEHGMDTPENYEAVGAVYDKAYAADMLHSTAPYAGILELLDVLHQKGIRLCVCSNKPHEVVEYSVDKLFADRFDVVCGIQPGMAVKPAPDCALAICAELGVTPAECLFVGDTNVDIRTAKNAGMTSVGVLWGFRDLAELESAGADYIVENPVQIAEIVTNF